MKKFISLILATTLCLSLVGCGGNKSSQDVISSIKTNMDEVSSVDMDLHIVSDITQKYEEIRIPQKIEYNLNIKETPDIAYITGEILTTVNETNNKYEIEAYQVTANMNNSLYFKQDGQWYKHDTEGKKSYAMKLLQMFYEANMSFSGESAEINGQQCNVLAAEVYGENAQVVSDMIGVKTSEEEKIGIALYTFKEAEYPAYAKIDLKNVANNSLKTKDIKNTINNMYVEITFNSFNQTEVELPDDIRKNATKQKEEQSVIQKPETEVKDDNNESPEQPNETEKPGDIEVITQKPDDNNENQEHDTKLSKEWNAFQFDYNGVIYRIPMSYKTFESSGYALNESEKSRIMEKGQSYTTTLYNGELTVLAKLENTTTAPKTLSECDIVSIDFDTYSLPQDELAKFMFNNNVNFAASYESIVELWGEPTNMHDGTALKIATYKDGDNTIEIYFDPETNGIIEYKISAK